MTAKIDLTVYINNEKIPMAHVGLSGGGHLVVASEYDHTAKSITLWLEPTDKRFDAPPKWHVEEFSGWPIIQHKTFGVKPQGLDAVSGNEPDDEATQLYMEAIFGDVLED